MKILIVDKQSLQIASKYDADAPNQGQYGGPWGWPDQTQHIAIPEEMDADCVKAEMQGEEIVIVEDQEKIQAKLDQSRENKLELLRKKRDEKLKRVDLLVNIAVLNSWTAAEKTELKNYRQALLDITELMKQDMSLLDSLDIEAMEWPVEPSEA